MVRTTVVATLFALLNACGASSSKPIAEPTMRADGPPAARTVAVTETHFGITLKDPYRWMESPDNAKELSNWLRAQGAYTRAQLDRIEGLPALRDEMHKLSEGTDSVRRPQRRGTRLFFLRIGKGESIAELYVRDAGKPERALLDPATLETDPKPAAIDGFAASPDGARVAVNISHGGSEISTIEVFDVATGKRLPDTATPVWGQFQASWLPDGSGFYYTQMAAKGFTDPKVDKMLDMVVRFHRLGTDPKADTAVLGPGVAPSMPIQPSEFPLLQIPVGSKWAVAFGAQARLSFRFAVAPISALAKAPAAWRVIADYDDMVQDVAIRGDQLYVLSKKDAPNGKVLRLSLADPDLAKATTFVPEGDRVIQSLSASRDALNLVDLVGGTSGLRRIDYDGKLLAELTPPGSSISLSVSDTATDGVIVRVEGWTRPARYMALGPAAADLRPIGLAETSPVDLSGIAIERFEVPSTGGVKVPLTVLHDAHAGSDGKRPTIVFGYGGYGITLTPEYRPLLAAWFERGGVYAICNVRGGGAKGQSWYEAGKGANKPNGVRDFVNCARFLAQHGYTTPDRVAAYAKSMGGVLAGRAVTESPDAFGAADIEVGDLDVLRILNTTNGANSIPEIGTPDTEAGLKALVAMDAYQNIVPGKQYPAMILPIGLNDQRVPPFETAKFAARMQASGSKAPVLIRVQAEAGHGRDSTREQRTDERADEWAFLLNRFGDPQFRMRDR